MNNLELKTMGVQDLDTNEMVNVEGGIAPIVYVCALGVGYLIGAGIRLYAAR